MTQLAALPALAEAKSRNLTALVEYVELLADIPPATEPLLTINPALKAYAAFDGNTNQLAMAMAPLQATADYAVRLETSIAYWYQMVFGALVPLYGPAYSFFLSSVCRSGSELMMRTILGPSRQSVFGLRSARLSANTALSLTYTVLKGWRMTAKENRPTMVGHGANGILMKAVALDHDPRRVALESPKFDDSPLIPISDYAKTDQAPAISRVVNFFTAGGIYAHSDASASQNLETPSYGINPLRPPDAWDTLCFFAAACDPDDRFHTLCGEVLGDDDDFYNLHILLGRHPQRSGDGAMGSALGREL
jgi:hypothetical protein